MALASVVWHFWIAVPLALGAVASVVLFILGYLHKVTYKRYPRN